MGHQLALGSFPTILQSNMKMGWAKGREGAMFQKEVRVTGSKEGSTMPLSPSAATTNNKIGWFISKWNMVPFSNHKISCASHIYLSVPGLISDFLLVFGKTFRFGISKNKTVVDKQYDGMLSFLLL